MNATATNDNTQSRDAILATVIDRIDTQEGLFVTAISDHVSTFGPDNIAHFKDWALMQLAKLEGGTIGCLALVMRRDHPERSTERFTKNGVGVRLKQAYGCRITRTAIHMLTADEMRRAFNTDTTGRPLPHDPTVTFIDFETWLHADASDAAQVLT